MDTENNNLNILSIFHYVFAGISGISACFPIFHLILGLSILFGNFYPDDVSAEMPFPFEIFGLMFTIIPAAIIFLGWAIAIALAISGYYLSKRRHYNFCLIMAGISCVLMPFGTILGVFTIIELLKEDAKESFSHNLVQP
jgi:hypothetical protein